MMTIEEQLRGGPRRDSTDAPDGPDLEAFARAATLLPAICPGIDASPSDPVNRLRELCNRRHAARVKQRYCSVVRRHDHRRGWRSIQDVYNNLGRREIA